MERNGRIAFIGAGNLAEALIDGLLQNEVFDRSSIDASAPRPARRDALRERFGINVHEKNEDAARRASIVVLSVKPQILPGVVAELAGTIDEETLVITVAAGIETELIESVLGGATRVVRAMPNVPVVVGSGVTAIAAGSAATDDDLATARILFEAVGSAVVVAEDQLDVVTGLSGSGPAYLLLVIEALSDAGVKLGLSRRSSLFLAARTMLGTANLLIETGQHPAVLRETVTSPGGTAIAGLHELERGGLRAVLIDAVETATRRAAQLGKNRRVGRAERSNIVPVTERRRA